MSEALKATELDRPLRRGEQATVEIDKLTHDGRGVARVGGKVLFVSDALPGELVDATVVRRRRGHDEARLDELHRASAARMAPPCEWFGACGGCSLQHLTPDAQLQTKQQWMLDALRRIGAVEPQRVLDPLRGPTTGYRRRARLGVKYVDGKGRVLVGFRERHKPYITDMGGCEVLDPQAAALIGPLQELIGKLSICRRLPQIEVAVGEEGVVLVCRVLDPPDADDLQKMQAFAVAHGVTLALQPGKPDDARNLDGTVPRLHYRLADHGLRLAFGPTDFVQINAAINDSMIASVLQALEPGPTDRVLDLFCGLGNFTLPMARLAAHVVGVEGSGRQVGRARENAASNGIENVTFIAADLGVDLGGAPFLADGYDLLVLDPPRSGAAEVCEQAARIGARRIAYVSCHPATLARDAGTLVRDAGYRLVAAGVMDMFPHTAHVESLAIFERAA